MTLTIEQRREMRNLTDFDAALALNRTLNELDARDEADKLRDEREADLLDLVNAFRRNTAEMYVWSLDKIPQSIGADYLQLENDLQQFLKEQPCQPKND